ncbi:unnamed protein product [Paramecium pentaurelia]|uniref:Meckelin n=1 Tax=Paramecium pentaurelia TaxID=43138 RepID=A0A8S1VEG1_9CILI|nr:unnamed protein product [Paramecium pentaurelia]
MLIYIVVIQVVQGLQSYTECASDQYYNTAIGECTQCPQNTVRYNISLCVCDNTQGYQRSGDNIIGFQYDQLCLKQANNCTLSQVNLKYSFLGDTLSQNTCTSCAANAYANAYREQCIPCPDKLMVYTGSCECPQSGYIKSYDRCVLSTQKTIGNLIFDSSYIVEYETDQRIASSYILNRYQYAISMCYYYSSINACQLLANLCALQLFDLTKPICSVFLEELKSKISTSAPALFPSVNIETINIYQTVLPQTMKLDDSDSKNRRYLNYSIQKYDLEGNMISDTTLRSEFIFCPHSPGDEINSRAFGLNMKISCSLDLDAFLQNYEMYLYELQVTAVRDDNTINPQNVYFLVNNLKDKDGNKPNSDSASQSSIFVKRIFLVDTITSKKDYTNPAETPEYIRYASKIKIVILPSQDSYEQIYVPYVYVEYSIVRNSGESFGYADFEFAVQISPNPTNYWITIIILFAIYNVIILLVWLFRIYVWTKANPSNSIRENYMWQLLKNMIQLLIDSWTDWMFYFLFFMTAYWFVFFKFQNTPFLLMLDQNDSSNYLPFYGLFYTIFALRLIQTLVIIYAQSSINIYFIDWETTEIHRPIEKRRQEELEENEVLVTANKIKSKVSVWRTLLVANEFNELSTVRTVSVEWTLIILGFVLIGLGFQKRFIESPDLIETQPYVPENPILKYFLVQFVYLMIGLGQLILRKILNIWQPYPYENFVDLCTIANVSIFILDDNLHGYYIHGENPLGFSEGGIPHLQECLRNESKNKGKNRGLVKDGYDSQLCTYELFVPPEFKHQFEMNYQGIRNYKEKREMKQLGIENVELQKFKIEQFLKSKINEVKKVDKRANFIRTKETAQRYFDYPPDELAYDDFNKSQVPYFYKDPDFQYRRVFFSGYEMYFLVTDIIIFTFFVLVTQNVALSILLQYFCTKFFEWLKQEWQKTNISEKTKIDKRFLI